MNMIRKRAGIPGYGETVNLPKPTTTEEVMELIRKEKRIELSFEMCIRDRPISDGNCLDRLVSIQAF